MDVVWSKKGGIWLLTVNSSSSCARPSLVQFKVLHRMNLTNVKLSKLFPGVDVICNRCSLAPADHSHAYFFLVLSWKIFVIPFLILFLTFSIFPLNHAL